MSWPKEPPGAEPWHLVIVERDGDRYDCRIVHPGCPLLVTAPRRGLAGDVSHRCDVQVEVENVGWESIFGDPEPPEGVWLVTLTYDAADTGYLEDRWACWHHRRVTVEAEP